MYDLVGKQYLDFIDKDNKPVKGVRLHVVGYDGKTYEGLSCIHIFIKIDSPVHDKALDLKLGKIDIKYGPRNVILDVLNV